ncbi:MAG: MerR family transcriptional regulator [Lachnospiraceae bacterium]|nr:MerR family transcriptional regulator [Lachnospiraceae bacterium]
MRIGEFAEKYSISRETLRYYVSVGLLSPRMQGKQMDFSEREEEDLRYILRLKKMRFNIREIRSLIYLNRMSNMIESSTLDQFRTLMGSKREELLREKQDIDVSLQMIAEMEEELERNRDISVEETGGVPLSAISLLACPCCGKPLEITNANIRSKYIYSGELTCMCGYRAQIVNGILCTGNEYSGDYDSPDLTRKLYHDTGEEWTVASAKCSDFLLETLADKSLSRQVILEANVNGYFFVYNFLSDLPKDCLYIIIDKYEEVLARYKMYIERLYPNLDILYIADASERFPLRTQSVDLFVSMFGENEYGLYHKNCQMRELYDILKPSGQIVGVFQSFSLHSATWRNLCRQYPEGSDRRSNIDCLQTDLMEGGYKLEMQLLGKLTKTLKHHIYKSHVDGEEILLYGIQAWKQGGGR